MKNRKNKVYYGSQTEQAIENFPFPHHKASLELMYAITQIKKAAASAHAKIGEMDKQISSAIVSACDEILDGKYDDQFVTIALQGGAGTSINMNVNEVIAARASEISEGNKIHPNDHVNRSQSTNDVNPSALKIVCLSLSDQLLNTVDSLIATIEKRAEEFKSIKKLARTHIQDAVPITFGDEFNSYANILRRDRQRIADTQRYLYDLNLGGTAVGNSINASPEYINAVYEIIQKQIDKRLKKTVNLMSLTSSQTDFYYLSAALCALSLDLSKISNDIRFMASGPRGGIGEIQLQPLQNGSSIMPGKVNPVIPESMNQVYYFISGKHLTIEHAVEGAHLELGIMFPVIADSIISSMKLLISTVNVFNSKCISTLKIDEDMCRKHLESSTAYATLLAPKLGYDTTAKAVKEAIKRKKSVREVVVESKLLSNEEFDLLVN